MTGHAHTGDASPAGSVVLHLMQDMGALVINAGPERLGVEIEISPMDDNSRPRTHSLVRERLVSPNRQYDAVYPDVPAGRYRVWQDAHTVAGTVEIRGGEVAWFTMP